MYGYSSPSELLLECLIDSIVILSEEKIENIVNGILNDEGFDQLKSLVKNKIEIEKEYHESLYKSHKEES
jgi:hypothetical protein